MSDKHYRILNKRQAALLLAGLFLAAVLLIIAAAAVPYAYASLTAQANRRLPIYCTDRADKVVSLTFDAAWGDEDTPELIRILEEYDVKATFFTVGEWVERCSDSVLALSEAGHEIMNHSDTHPHMPQLSRERMIQEINACNDRIEAITGIKPILFRAPYGDYSNALIETTDELNMYCIQWDVDSLDWKDLAAGEITQRVTSKVQPGSIVLFHNAALHTPEALPAIIQTLLQEGYTFVPISQIILTGEYTIDHTGRQCPA